MITLKDWLILIDYKITEGSSWYCNIPNLYSLTTWNGEQDGYSLNIVYDPTDNQKVYISEVCDYKTPVAYMIKLPEIETDNQAWDECEYIVLNDDQDFLRKALDIIERNTSNGNNSDN